jgi:succinate dehydrogenase / fumarate reductase cytochrome b subunit
MVIFILVHMLGNLELFGGPEALNTYALRLRFLPPLLWIARIGLLVLLVAHVASSLRLTALNMKARPMEYRRKKNVATSFAARTMLLTGIVIFVFVVFHILHFTLRTIYPEYQTMHWDNGRGGFGHDVYAMVVDSFSNHKALAAVYAVAMFFLGLHVSHGFSSMFQTLGMSHPRYHAAIRKAGPIFATIVVLGFISVPLAVLFGLVHPGGF